MQTELLFSLLFCGLRIQLASFDLLIQLSLILLFSFQNLVDVISSPILVVFVTSYH